jgi:hypothetical protein
MNTISAGFWFQLGRTLADLAIAGGIFVLIFIVVFVLIILSRRR